jgi:NAD(P)-dependent dehydrogenase (short-subunit alcohol dehydrogenase family)
VPSADAGGSSTIGDGEWIESLTINFLASVRVTNAALDALGASGNGAIVDMSSGSATDPSPRVLHYASAKAALLAYNAGLAKELAPRGIRVNAVLPGRVDTPGGTRAMQTIADAIGAPLQTLRDGIPLGRVGDARDIADMVAFLVSDRAQWITGERFVVDGGE